MIVRGTSLSDPKKILVRATNWIGDAVISIPALEALRASFQAAEIVVLAKPWVSELYWHHPAVSRQIILDPAGEHKGTRGFWKLIRVLREESFDAALLFQNAFHAAWMAWCARIPCRVGYARDGRSPLLTDAVEALPAAHGHQVNYYLHLLLRSGFIEKPGPVQEVRLVLTESEKNWAGRRLDSLGLRGPRFLVGFSPGATFGPAKRWPPDRFAALADRLIGSLHADVLIFGSREERPLAEGIAREMKHTPIILAGETTVRQLLDFMSQCRLIVSNDSGPMHLAAALGVPLVAIFGSTEVRATGPIGSLASVVLNRAACSPCGLRECPIDFRCLAGVTVDSVHRATLELVKETERQAKNK